VSEYHHGDQEKAESGCDVAQAVQCLHHTDGLCIRGRIRIPPASQTH
jgi:hypothetical protein